MRHLLPISTYSGTVGAISRSRPSNEWITFKRTDSECDRYPRDLEVTPGVPTVGAISRSRPSNEWITFKRTDSECDRDLRDLRIATYNHCAGAIAFKCALRLNYLPPFFQLPLIPAISASHFFYYPRRPIFSPCQNPNFASKILRLKAIGKWGNIYQHNQITAS